MTDKQENTLTAADQSEQGSGTTPDTQEALQDTSSSKEALQSIDFDISIGAPTEQRLPTAEEFKGISESVDRVKSSLQRMADEIQSAQYQALSGLKTQNLLQGVTESIRASISALSETVWGDIEGITKTITESVLSSIGESLKSLKEGFEEERLYAEQLKPFIAKELKAAKKDHPEIEEITADDIVESCYLFVGDIEEAEVEELQQEFSDYTDPVLKHFKLLYGIVKKAKEAFEVGKDRSLLPQISSKKITELQYPLDKVNASLWGLILPKEKTALKAESDKDGKKGKQANIYVLLDFDELDGIKISRQLTSYDKRVFIAVANLKAQGHDTITAWQVYTAMGGVSRPKKDTIEKIIQSIETLSKCRVTIDNTEEAKLYTKYDRVKATFPLLTTKICSGYANGKIVDNAITVSEVPDLLTFAEKRGQLTTVPLRLFESPISKTEANLLLEDYLFNRIARMKNSPKITRTILLETIYLKCNISSRNQKARLPEKIERLLQFWKGEKWVSDFTITERSIEIIT